MSRIPILQQLLDEAKIGTDDAFKKVLLDHQHCEDFIAPEALRQFLTNLKIIRIQFGIAYALEGGIPTLNWWMGEVGVRGRVESVLATIHESLSAHNFSLAESDPDQPDLARYVYALDQVEQEASIRGPRRWTGSREPSCGFEVSWKARAKNIAPMVSLNVLLDALPVLRDERVFPGIYVELKDIPVQFLAVGGTWTRYYDWDVMLVSPDASSTHLCLQDLLQDAGFIAKQIAESTETWHNPDTGSFAYLTSPDDEGLVEFRIQPES